jgi:hypothetical protein
VAVKIKKRRPDAPVEEENALVEDDQVLAASKETFDFLQDHRSAVIGGIVVLVVGIIAVSLMLDSRKAASADAAGGLYAALATATAPVGEGGEYTDIRARAAAVAAEATTVVAEHESDPLGNTARLLAAHGALQQGDAATAQQQFAAFRTSKSGAPEANVAAFGEAAAMAEAGDVAGAVALLATLGGQNEALGFAAALQSARIQDAFSGGADALAAYRTLVDAYPAEAGQVFVSNRIAQLEIELGVEPVVTPSADGETPGE